MSSTDWGRDIFETRSRGLQHHGLRRANERAVLNVVGFNPGLSNAEIARMSGLAPQTVSAILLDVESQGLIMRGDVLRGRRGQPATPISLNPDGAFSIGVELGWKQLDVLLLDLQGVTRGHERRTFDYPDPRTVFDLCAEMIQTLKRRSPEAEWSGRLLDLGLSIPTTVPTQLCRVPAPQEVQALWQWVDPVAELQGRTGLEVSMFNDGNAACWGELVAFPKPRPASFIYFLVTHYIAAGLVIEGSLWEGPSGNAANLGSMLVANEHGNMVSAHEIASVSALANQLYAAGIDTDAANIRQWDWTSFGDLLETWLQSSGRSLARIIFNTTAIIETGLVVLDSIMPASITERLVSVINDELIRLPASDATPRPVVLAGHLGYQAPSVGAAKLALYKRYFSNDPV
jgi:predicted NBD/HSP70 family sugar kinase